MRSTWVSRRRKFSRQLGSGSGDFSLQTGLREGNSRRVGTAHHLLIALPGSYLVGGAHPTFMTDVIVTEGLTKYYGGRPVVDSLNLRVPQGSVYGLLGRNGAGKSTAIKMLMGMVRPDSGRATLLGEDSATLSDAPRARIAYLAEGHPLYGWMAIGEA